MEFIVIIYSNTLQSMMAIVKAMSTLNINYGQADQQVRVCWTGTRRVPIYKSIRSLCQVMLLVSV